MSGRGKPHPFGGFGTSALSEQAASSSSFAPSPFSGALVSSIPSAGGFGALSGVNSRFGSSGFSSASSVFRAPSESCGSGAPASSGFGASASSVFGAPADSSGLGASASSSFGASASSGFGSFGAAASTGFGGFKVGSVSSAFVSGSGSAPPLPPVLEGGGGSKLITPLIQGIPAAPSLSINSEEKTNKIVPLNDVYMAKDVVQLRPALAAMNKGYGPHALTGTGCSETEILAAEDRFGVTFPRLLKDFLKITDGREHWDEYSFAVANALRPLSSWKSHFLNSDDGDWPHDQDLMLIQDLNLNSVVKTYWESMRDESPEERTDDKRKSGFECECDRETGEDCEICEEFDDEEDPDACFERFIENNPMQIIEVGLLSEHYDTRMYLNPYDGYFYRFIAAYPEITKLGTILDWLQADCSRDEAWNDEEF